MSCSLSRMLACFTRCRYICTMRCSNNTMQLCCCPIPGDHVSVALVSERVTSCYPVLPRVTSCVTPCYLVCYRVLPRGVTRVTSCVTPWCYPVLPRGVTRVTPCYRVLPAEDAETCAAQSEQCALGSARPPRGRQTGARGAPHLRTDGHCRQVSH